MSPRESAYKIHGTSIKTKKFNSSEGEKYETKLLEMVQVTNFFLTKSEK